MRGHGGDGVIVNARLGMCMVFVTGGIWSWVILELVKGIFN